MIRIVLTGVECTGKTTLGPLLAEHFGGVVVTEYGREWAQTKGLDFTRQALRDIAAGHVRVRKAAAAAKPPVIIEDTDIVMTSAWARMLHGQRDPVLTGIPASADLYLLFAPDTEWIDDGTRQFGGVLRDHFHAIVEDELAHRGIQPVLISGDWDHRIAASQAAITALIDCRNAAAE